MIVFDPNKKALFTLREQLQLLSLRRPQRRKLLREIGKEASRQTKRNIVKQQSPDGKPWQSRKGGGRGKMLKKLSKRLKAYPADKEVTIKYWHNGVGKTAFRHHYGGEEKWWKKRWKEEREEKGITGDEPVTRHMAKELLSLGYTIESKTKRGKTRAVRPSQKWILANFTMAEAIAKARELKGEMVKNTWIIKNPARPFMGMKDGSVLDIARKQVGSNIRGRK